MTHAKHSTSVSCTLLWEIGTESSLQWLRGSKEVTNVQMLSKLESTGDSPQMTSSRSLSAGTWLHPDVEWANATKSSMISRHLPQLKPGRQLVSPWEAIADGLICFPATCWSSFQVSALYQGRCCWWAGVEGEISGLVTFKCQAEERVGLVTRGELGVESSPVC